MKKMKTFSAKALSLVCALALVLTAVVIPSAMVTTSAANSPANHDYFFVDYTKDGAFVPEPGVAYTDDAGNSFYPFNFYQGYSSYMQLQQKEINVDGTPGKILDFQSVVTSDNVSAKAGNWTFIPQDANGKPFVLDPNCKYEITVTYRGKCFGDWEKIYVGSGALQAKDYLDAESQPAHKDYNGTTAGSYTWSDCADAEAKIEFPTATGTAFANTLLNMSAEKIVAYSGGSVNADAMAGNFTGAPGSFKTTITTADLDYVDNKYSIEAGDNTYTYGNYLTVYNNKIGTKQAVDADGNPETTEDITYYYNGMCIASVEAKKLVSFTLDAGDGLVNAQSVYEVEEAACGSVLPVAFMEGQAFKGWYYDEALTEPVGDYIVGAVDGKTLYAKYGEGVTITFDNGEPIAEGTQFLDEEGILSDDNSGYVMYSWFPGQPNGSITNPTGYTSTTFRMGAGNANTWGSAGGYVFNDGEKAIMVERGKSYKVSYSVFMQTTSSLLGNEYLNLAISPKWDTTGDSGRITTFNKVFEKTGLQLQKGSESYTYYVNGEAKQATSGQWVRCSDIIAVDSIGNPSDTSPLPAALGFKGTAFGQGKYVFIDDIVIEEVTAVTFIDGSTGKTTIVTGSLGDTLVAPTPDYKGGVFEGWYTADGSEEFADEIFTEDNNGAIFYAKWDYSSFTATFEGYEKMSGNFFYSEDGRVVTADEVSDYMASTWSMQSYKQAALDANGNPNNAAPAYNWGQAYVAGGFYELNDGLNTFTLKEGKNYTVKFKVKAMGSTAETAVQSNAFIDIGYGPKFVAEADNDYGRMASANVDITGDDVRLVQFTADSTEFQYFDGTEMKTGYVAVDGKDGWYDVKYAFTVNEIPEPTDNVPFPGVFGITGSRSGGATILIDDICIEEVQGITFDAGNVKTFIPGNLGEEIPFPANPDRIGFAFNNWEDEDGNVFTDTLFTEDNLGSIVKANYTQYAKVYDFEGKEIFCTESLKTEHWQPENSEDQLGAVITYNDTEFKVVSWSFNQWKAKLANTGKDSKYAMGIVNGNTAYSQNGSYMLNDGEEFCILNPKSSYKVEMDVQVKGLKGPGASLVYGASYYDGWSSTNGKTYDGKYSVILSRINEGTEDEPVYSETKFNYVDNGEVKEGTFGEDWLHVTYYFDTPEEFAEATEIDPIPAALAIFGQRMQGDEFYFDNIVVEEAKIRLKLGEGVTCDPVKAFYGETVTLPTPVNENTDLLFAGWFDQNGEKAGAEVVGKAEVTTYEAVFVAKAGSVTFMNDDETVYDTFNGNAGDAVVFPADPTSKKNPESDFLGWFTADGKKVTSLYLLGEDVALVAKFSGNVIYGDVTGEGVLDASDLVRLKKHLAGQKVEYNAANADCNGDGTVDATDLVRLKKYFAGQHVVLGPDK